MALATLESRRTHIAGFGRDQLLLLPEAVDDYVEVDNPFRFIEAFVDGLDLAGAGFARVEAKATGRPGYAPGDLLKLYVYGYLNRVRSSRRLERKPSAISRSSGLIEQICQFLGLDIVGGSVKLAMSEKTIVSFFRLAATLAL